MNIFDIELSRNIILMLIAIISTIVVLIYLTIQYYIRKSNFESDKKYEVMYRDILENGADLDFEEEEIDTLKNLDKINYDAEDDIDNYFRSKNNK